ncbi:hypothetical protein MMC21_003912 [Puttea exsequens]|nr:hypothetical protein [Puttea exsequens]
MSAITRLQKETGLEEPESAPDSMTGSPSFSPVHTSSSQSSLSSLGTSSSSADGKEEGSKLEHRAHKQLNIDDVDAPLVMAAELADDEVALAAVDGDEVDAALPKALASGNTDASVQLDTKKGGEYGKLQDTFGNTFELPVFTVKDIRSAIPAHCYERNAVRFLTYVASDMMKLILIWGLAQKYLTPEYIPSTLLIRVLWVVYGIVNGCIGTGLWVLAHECGHQSCSPSKTINDTVGFICHSVLLVPYFSWKISHGKHHKATGNIERDMVFVPSTREQYAAKWKLMAHELSELVEDTPVKTATDLVLQQLFGWPIYLLNNVTGHNFHERQPEGRGIGKKNGWFGGVNHFFPSSPLYEAKDAKLILASDVGLGVVATVAITYLQHTDPTLPHYQDSSVWNFARGAAATIDRDLGFVGRHVMHGIIETHVLHHFVSNIPFYQADEASEAIKPVLGSHYRSAADEGPLGFFKALWCNSRICQWLESAPEAEGAGRKVLFYRNKNGLGLPPAKISPAGDASSKKER